MDTESGRIVIKYDKAGNPKTEIVVGDLQFYPNNNNVYKYTCNWKSLMGIANDIRSGKDCSSHMFNYITNEGKLELVKDDFNEDKDKNGQVFSTVETAVLSSNQFDAFVAPSPGTIYRYAKVLNLAINNNKIKIFFVSPPDYPVGCSKQVIEDFHQYIEHIKLACKECKLDISYEVVTWNEIPTNVRVYVSSYGWKLNEHNLTGVGLELNINVAVSLGLSMINYDMKDDHYAVAYIRNNKQVNYKYYYNPIAKRIHGGDMCKGKRTVSSANLNLFNIVHQNFNLYVSPVSVTTDLRFVHCSNRYVCPQIVKVDDELFENKRYTFGYAQVNDELVKVALLGPGFELSTRRKMFGDLGFKELPYVDGPFTVFSSLTGSYANFDGKNSASNIAQYLEELLNFPSKWLFDGVKWQLRAYPLAIKVVELPRRKKIKQRVKLKFDFEIGEKKYLIDKLNSTNAVWANYNNLNKKYELIVESEFYDYITLVCHKKSNWYFKNGDLTILYSRVICGKPFMSKKCSIVYVQEANVTIMLPLNVVKGENSSLSKVMYTDCVVYKFDCCESAASFYCQNVSNYKNKIWQSDLKQTYDFVDPRYADRMLVDLASVFNESYMFSMPLQVRDILRTSYNFDVVGNYYFFDRGIDSYDVFEFEEEG